MLTKESTMDMCDGWLRAAKTYSTDFLLILAIAYSSISKPDKISFFLLRDFSPRLTLEVDELPPDAQPSPQYLPIKINSI